MNRLFADAGYWIALLNPKDSLHAKARAMSVEVGRARMVTSELVLTEVLNALASKGDFLRQTACRIVDRLRSNPNCDIVPMTSASFHESVERYRSRSDKTWGLTDCSSFLIMDAMGLSEVLSADHDFQQAGFRALLLE